MKSKRVKKETPTFDPSIYPRVYRGEPTTAIVMILMALGLAFYTYFISQKGFVLLCIYAPLLIFSFNMLFSKIILYSDRIVYKSWFSKREMLREDVAYLTWVNHGKFGSPGIANKDKTKKPFIIHGPPFVKDDAWRAWMSIAKTKKELSNK